VIYYTLLRPHGLALGDDAVARELAPLALLAITAALIWLCVTRRWLPGPGADRPPGSVGPPSAKVTEVSPGRST
jgi:hypothetical protein